MPDHFHPRGGGAVDDTSSIDATAFIGRDPSDPTAQIVGPGVYVGAGSWIGFGNTIGQDTVIGSLCRIVGGVDVGTGCIIGDNVFIDTGAEIGDDVTICECVRILTGIVVGDGASIGSGNVIDANVAAGEVIPPIGGGSSGQMPGSLGRYLARAVSLAGLDSEHLQWVYDPMTLSLQPIVTSPAKVSVGGWVTNQTAVFGSKEGLGGFNGGVQQLFATPGGAAPVFSALTSDADSAAYVIESGAERWYFATHARLTTGAIEALQGGWGGVCSDDENHILRMGANGRVSTTHFSIAEGAFNVVDSSQTGTVVLDNVFHLFEMWCAADNLIHWAIDGVVQTSLVNPDDLENLHLFNMVELAASSVAAVGWEIDDVCMVFADAV